MTTTEAPPTQASARGTDTAVADVKAQQQADARALKELMRPVAGSLTIGRLLAVVVMIFGVTLFLRLAQVLFRPNKVRYPCDECGLVLHDPDAVHCKHCGAPVRIPTEGFS